MLEQPKEHKAVQEDSSSCSSASNSPSENANVRHQSKHRHGQSSSLSSSSSSSSSSPPPLPAPVPCEKPDVEYIPPALRPFVFHSSEDFYISQYFDAILVAHLMYEGFLPIATQYQHRYLLLPKLHNWRSVVQLRPANANDLRHNHEPVLNHGNNNNNNSNHRSRHTEATTSLDHSHVPKSVKKRAKDYQVVLNEDFDQVVQGCHEQHGIPWLYPPIVETFREMFDQTKALVQQQGDASGDNADGAGADADAGAAARETDGAGRGGHRIGGIELFELPDHESTSSRRQQPPRQKATIRFFTIEIRDKATNRLCAGEIGYTCGKTYTSLTGFSRVNGLGTVQLHALKQLLWQNDFAMWDLGMAMQYKNDLGASDLTRDQFVQLLAQHRSTDCVLKLPNHHTQMSVKALFNNPPPNELSSAQQESSFPSTHASRNTTTPSKKALKKALKQQQREQAKAAAKAKQQQQQQQQLARGTKVQVDQAAEQEARQVKHPRTTA